MTSFRLSRDDSNWYVGTNKCYQVLFSIYYVSGSVLGTLCIVVFYPHNHTVR